MNVPADLEQRAWWHLELSPEHFYEPLLVDPVDQPPQFDCRDEFDDIGDPGDRTCTHCGGEGFAEVDDPLWDDCDEFGWGPCSACNGTGLRSRQWVF